MQTVILAMLMVVGADRGSVAMVEDSVPAAVWNGVCGCRCPGCSEEREMLAQAMSRPRMSAGRGTNPKIYGHFVPWFGFLSRNYCGPRVTQYPNAMSLYYRGRYDYRRTYDFPWRTKPSCVPYLQNFSAAHNITSTHPPSVTLSPTIATAESK